MLVFLPIILFHSSSKFYLLFSLTLPIILNKILDNLNDNCTAFIQLTNKQNFQWNTFVGVKMTFLKKKPSLLLQMTAEPIKPVASAHEGNSAWWLNDHLVM